MQHKKININNINNYTNVVVIPAYEPDKKMITLLMKLHSIGQMKIIVVDDGSGEKFHPIFKEAMNYADVISYMDNKGKGGALKEAFAYIKKKYGSDVFIVTADCDGQHTTEDILLIYKELIYNPQALVLGSRQELICTLSNRDKSIPIRSILGNSITRMVFYLSAHKKVFDTQTGLRGFSGMYLDYMIDIEGSRYEYEMNVLMKAAKDNMDIIEVPIKTIYIDDNKSTHFNTIKDSYRIYKQIIKYSLSSLISFITDYVLFIVLSFISSGLGTLSIPLSNITARIFSASLNYTLNRNFVFNSNEDIKKSIPKYITLALSVLVINTCLLLIITNGIMSNQYIAKIIVEVIMFVLNGIIQKFFIFNETKNKDILMPHKI